VEETNPYAPPKSQVELISEPGGIWRKEKLLVMRNSAELPDRCIYCNKIAELSKKRRILYLNIWLRIVLILLFLAFNFLALIPILIIVLIFRKSAKIKIPICQNHRKKRLLITLASVTVLLISIGFSFLAVKGSGYQESYFMVSLGVFLVAFVLAIIRGQLLRAKKIDTEVMIFKGARSPFLDSLPEYAEQ
jgi:hypothetical protein